MNNNNQPNQINPLLNSGGLSSGRYSPHKNKLMAVIIALVAAGALAAWWFLYQKPAPSPVAQPTASVTPTAEEVEVNQVEGIDVGDVDKEFQTIDNDLNSLDATNPIVE